MKLPSWLVIAMLTTSMVSVLAAAGWWWVTWPDRTAREFVACVAEKRLDDAERILHSSEGLMLVRFGATEKWSEDNLRRESRTFREVLHGRQTFHLAPVHRGLYTWKFTVDRGKVIYEPLARSKGRE